MMHTADNAEQQGTPTPRTVDEKIALALKMVSDLCDKRREWTMSVPARPDYDPDLVIADALYTAKRELSAAKAEAERLREALSFYAEDRRYFGPNQRREEGDKWTPESHPYMVDVSRDRGEIARTALAAIAQGKGEK